MTFEQLRDQTCRRAGISTHDFYYGRSAPKVWARKVVAHKLRKQGYSLDQIGILINRDHSTVVYLLKTPPAPPVRKLIKCSGT